MMYGSYSPLLFLFPREDWCFLMVAWPSNRYFRWLFRRGHWTLSLDARDLSSLLTPSPRQSEIRVYAFYSIPPPHPRIPPLTRPYDTRTSQGRWQGRPGTQLGNLDGSTSRHASYFTMDAIPGNRPLFYFSSRLGFNTSHSFQIALLFFYFNVCVSTYNVMAYRPI